ncbi:MAG: septal ring lytic transglycosylase RlpA family protein [Hyphomicrobiaceae bacterium]|nr:septal ring lytic transglycosylase RlpA family protein [Hyphomicrobiaceae bacterium]
MRCRATLTIAACLASTLLASSALAQASEASAALSDITDGAASVGRDAVRATDKAALQVREHVEDAWAATVAREPELSLKSGPPREIKRPSKPQLAARPPAAPGKGGKQHALNGIASYYWQGQMTASGEPFNKRDMTAAHPSLPFGTKVRVFCANTGRDVVVRINDRGPFKPGRIIDLSEAAAEAIGMQGRGLTTVQLEVVRN